MSKDDDGMFWCDEAYFDIERVLAVYPANDHRYTVVEIIPARTQDDDHELLTIDRDDGHRLLVEIGKWRRRQAEEQDRQKPAAEAAEAAE